MITEPQLILIPFVVIASTTILGRLAAMRTLKLAIRLTRPQPDSIALDDRRHSPREAYQGPSLRYPPLSIIICGQRGLII
jgi:hypothetical protein